MNMVLGAQPGSGNQETGVFAVDASLPLRKATVQEIQLELLRRTQINGLDGDGFMPASSGTGVSGWQSCSTGQGSPTTRSRASC